MPGSRFFAFAIFRAFLAAIFAAAPFRFEVRAADFARDDWQCPGFFFFVLAIPLPANFIPAVRTAVKLVVMSGNKLGSAVRAGAGRLFIRTESFRLGDYILTAVWVGCPVFSITHAKSQPQRPLQSSSHCRQQVWPLSQKAAEPQYPEELMPVIQRQSLEECTDAGSFGQGIQPSTSTRSSSKSWDSSCQPWSLSHSHSSRQAGASTSYRTKRM